MSEESEEIRDMATELIRHAASVDLLIDIFITRVWHELENGMT